ncbi:hypothetical protein BKA70DRAFT_1444979 [Coprinopsis sp. MPI-PUGE-AT-0042]|nr:hypothetical protein BKA70DRAFT_1444979 [Coprinopsis sp. MPI-PUGE-AT-0042]
MPKLIDFVAPTLLIYDYLCTLQEEVGYMWTSQWSIGLVMFYLNRYLVFVDQILLYYYASMETPSETACRRVLRAGTWILMIGENVSTVIIFLQTYAIWRGRPSVVYPLGVLQFAKVITSFVVTYVERRESVFRVSPSPSGPVCVLSSELSYMKYRYTLLILVEAATVCATVVRAKYHIETSNSPWVLQLYRNGVLYSIVALLLSIMGFIINEAHWKDPGTKWIMTKPKRVLDSLLCSRIMFVIFKSRQAANKHIPGYDQSTLWRMPTPPGNVLTTVRSSLDAVLSGAASTYVELDHLAPPEASQRGIN